MRLAWIVLASAPSLLGAPADAAGEAAPAPSGSPPAGFEAYQTILDRMPFGPEPPNFDPDVVPGSAAAAAMAAGPGEAARTEEEQQIVSSVRVSILNVTPAGAIAVGFTDSSVQPPVNYYMKVGETRDSWEVKAADPSEQTVTLSKNGVEAELKVGEAANGKGGAKPFGAGRPGQVARMSGNMYQAGGVPSGAGSSIRDRLRARRQLSAEQLKAEDAKREAAAAEARKQAEEARNAAANAAAEREQQREALLQIQEELRRQREERAALRNSEKQQEGEEAAQ